jgi:succinate-semialdehyde dehydrogenase / glutarate-semialdehyde dehydrogenase
MKPGDPLEALTALAPMSIENALKTLLDQVKRAVEGGATVLMDGERMDRAGVLLPPTILTDIEPSNPVFREKNFGPVALFFRVKGEEAAIALANDSDFGLGRSVFTRDEAA